jgi:hypothetical protein
VAKIKKIRQNRSVFLKKNNNLLILRLFWSLYQQIDSQEAEDEIGNPGGKEGRQAARNGKRLGNLHEQDVGEGNGDADTEMHTDASPHLAAR